MRGLHQTFFTQLRLVDAGLLVDARNLCSVAPLCVECRVNVNTKTFIAVPPHTTVSKDGSAPLGQTQVLTHATTGATGYGLRHPAVLL